MYISMIRLRRNVSPKEIHAVTKQNGYQAHRFVWDLFADHPERRRDFLYRYESVNGWPTFYTVSQREPLDANGMWEVMAKDYRPKLHPGQRLGFSLCANPIRSRRDANGRQHRHDVIMEVKSETKDQGGKINLPEIIQEHGGRWLMERAASRGFSILPDSVRVDGYRQHKLFKGKGQKTISYSTLDFNGIITVTNPDLFVEKCLFEGIGPAKGFGCGLMLVRRV